MPKGDNKVTINFTTEMKQFGDSKKGDLYLSFFTALAFLERYKDEFIAKYGQECYAAHIKRYSIPAIEVRNNSAVRKREALELKRKDLSLREKELAAKIAFLTAESTRMNDKHEDKSAEKADVEAKRARLELQRELHLLENSPRRTPETLKRIEELLILLGIKPAERQQQPHPTGDANATGI